MRATLAALALILTAAPAAAEITVWGKTATVLAGPMKSGRPGHDALLVQFASGRKVFVLRAAVDCSRAFTDMEVEACEDLQARR